MNLSELVTSIRLAISSRFPETPSHPWLKTHHSGGQPLSLETGDLEAKHVQSLSALMCLSASSGQQWPTLPSSWGQGTKKADLLQSYHSPSVSSGHWCITWGPRGGGVDVVMCWLNRTIWLFEMNGGSWLVIGSWFILFSSSFVCRNCTWLVKMWACNRCGHVKIQPCRRAHRKQQQNKQKRKIKGWLVYSRKKSRNSHHYSG